MRIFLLFLLPVLAWGQTIIPSTPYSRDFLRSTNATTARSKLGVVGTNQTVNPDQFDTTGALAIKSAAKVTNLNAYGTSVLQGTTKLGLTNELIITNGRVGVCKLPTAVALDVSGAIRTDTYYNMPSGGSLQSGVYGSLFSVADGVWGLRDYTAYSTASFIFGTNSNAAGYGLGYPRLNRSGAGLTLTDQAGTATSSNHLSIGGTFYGSGAGLSNIPAQGISPSLVQTPYIVRIDGDSHVSTQPSWPSAMTNLYLTNYALWLNFATNSKTTWQMVTNLVNFTNYVKSGATNVIALIEGGHNDLFNGTNWTNIVLNLSNCMFAARAAGYTVLIHTIPDNENFLAGPVVQSDRKNVNAWIRNSPLWHYLSDWDQVLDYKNTVGSGVHYSTNAYYKLAAETARALAGPRGHTAYTSGFSSVDVTSFGYGIVPIGSIVAWHKSLTITNALPTGWLECAGQTVNDIESPYNGQDLPNLAAANYFLRGATTSGGTGGSASHSHAVSSAGSGLMAGTDKQTTTTTTSSLPPYFEVVWIIRIK